jgi:ubiquinone/menaquinone biosynthesis C-methylase UbiE
MFTALIIIVAIFIIAWLTWHYASRRHSLPCPACLSFLVEMDNPFTKTNQAQTIIQHLDIKPGMRILDIGCGPGRLTIPLAKTVGQTGQVVALDIQQAMLNKVRDKANKEGLNNIHYINLDIGNNHLADAGFDRILLVTVIGEIPAQLNALKEIHTALSSHGILSVTEIIFDPHFHRQKTILKMAEQTGFKLKAIYGNAIAYTMHLVKSEDTFK